MMNFTLVTLSFIFLIFNNVAAEEQVFFDSNAHLLEQNIVEKWAHDPFLKSPGYSAEVKTKYDFKLQGLVYEANNPIAIIDGREFSVNQYLDGGFQVKDIGTNYVILSNGSSTRELQLPSVFKMAETSVVEETVTETQRDIASEKQNKKDTK
ncbi:MAG: hypothetical protein HOO06_01055 [Bdellovibrionaceae bacterium]|jgi:type II secretory pathway component PulC|nr:hypothetical protein [Pseudobdellovibrionaceae bacterium]